MTPAGGGRHSGMVWVVERNIPVVTARRWAEERHARWQDRLTARIT